MATPVVVARPSAAVADHVIVVCLGSALVYGALDQGAFYPRQLGTVAVLVGIAAVARAIVWRRPVPVAVVAAAGALVLFGGWALIRAAANGEVAAGYPTAVPAWCLAVAGLAAAGLSRSPRRVLVVVVLATAAVVAASCWVGVAFHLEPLALPSSGLWRGASTLTYANAAAAFLVVALALAVGVALPGPARTALVTVLLVGLLTTMSRAGAIGLAVAGAVYLAAGRDFRSLRPLTPALPAAAIAFAALLPSLPDEGPAQPGIALIGLGCAAGLLVAGRAVRPAHLLAGSAAVAVAAIGVLVSIPAARDAAADIVTTRLTAVSAERADLTRVTAAQFRTEPLVGVGPGRLDLRYVDHTGQPVHAFFTHDEYLQTAAETGLVGLGLVVAALAAFVVGALRLRTTAGAVVAAAVAGFAAHSAFDFLWHVPALPLLLVVGAVSIAD